MLSSFIRCRTKGLISSVWDFAEPEPGSIITSVILDGRKFQWALCLTFKNFFSKVSLLSKKRKEKHTLCFPICFFAFVNCIQWQAVGNFNQGDDFYLSSHLKLTYTESRSWRERWLVMSTLGKYSLFGACFCIQSN